MFVVAAMAVMLIGATALATDDAFADKKRHDDKKKGGYEKSQASHHQITVAMVNYQCMSSAKILAHKFRAKKTQ